MDLIVLRKGFLLTINMLETEFDENSYDVTNFDAQTPHDGWL